MTSKAKGIVREIVKNYSDKGECYYYKFVLEKEDNHSKVRLLYAWEDKGILTGQFQFIIGISFFCIYLLI